MIIIIIKSTILGRRNVAAYVAGSLKTVTHEIPSLYGLCLYLYTYGCGCTYWVTLSVFRSGTLQQ